MVENEKKMKNIVPHIIDTDHMLINSLIYVDTLKVRIDASIFEADLIGEWTKEKKYNLLYKTVYLGNGAPVTLSFFEKEKNCEMKFGTLFLQFSAPKLVYGGNTVVIKKSDVPAIIDILDCVSCSEGFCLDCSVGYTITRIDTGHCIRCSSEKEKNELMRIFSRIRLNGMKDGHLGTSECSCDGTVAKGSNPTNAIMYDKTKECRECRNEVIPDNVLRLEIQNKKRFCPEEKRQIKDFGLLSELSNKFYHHLVDDRYMLNRPCLPEKEYWQMVYKLSVGFTPKKQKRIIDMLTLINSEGASAAHDIDRKLYKLCTDMCLINEFSYVYTLLLYSVDLVSQMPKDNDPDIALGKMTADKPANKRHKSKNIGTISRHNVILELNKHKLYIAVLNILADYPMVIITPEIHYRI